MVGRTPAPVKLLLTPRDAAAALAVSARTLWGLTQPRGRLPCVRIGRGVRYALADLERYIAEQRQGGDGYSPANTAPTAESAAQAEAGDHGGPGK
jgi:excisionase family DNA binding protein